MLCPHCNCGIHSSWDHGSLLPGTIAWVARGLRCPECGLDTIEVAHTSQTAGTWARVWPDNVSRQAVKHVSIPSPVAADYYEACSVLPISAKASAALSRRCLQAMLLERGYSQKNLIDQIRAALAEADPGKVLPPDVRETVDAIRNFGNFSAHPLTDQTSLEVITVETAESEWCLEIVEALFRTMYIGPYEARARKDALNEKLKKAGKPPSL